MSETVLPCPACKSDYVHIQSAQYDAPPPKWHHTYRGEVVLLTGYCEEGHDWEISLAQHKGTTYIHARWRSAPDGPDEAPGPWVVS